MMAYGVGFYFVMAYFFGIWFVLLLTGEKYGYIFSR